jgi:hypothetical protein
MGGFMVGDRNNSEPARQGWHAAEERAEIMPEKAHGSFPVRGTVAMMRPMRPCPQGLCATHRWQISLVLVSSLEVGMSDAAAKPALDFVAALPAEVAGYRRTAAQYYGPESLFHYINGGAELYISYAFEQVAAFEYAPEKGAEIRVDIFDMGSAASAFGIFAHGRESMAREVGQGSEYSAGLLTFFRYRYYVSLLAYPESPSRKRVVYAIARHIERAIGRDGALPAVIGALPQANLEPASVKYFRHHNWLNSHGFVSHDNILHLGPDTEAALGGYADGNRRWSVVVVRYPDAEHAVTAHRSFLAHYLGGAATRRREDGKWSGVVRTGDQVTVVLRADRESDVIAALDRARKDKPHEQQNQPARVHP